MVACWRRDNAGTYGQARDCPGPVVNIGSLSLASRRTSTTRGSGRQNQGTRAKMTRSTFALLAVAMAAAAVPAALAIRQPAALVMGGYETLTLASAPLMSAELFGCSSNQDFRVDLPDMLTARSLAAAVYIPDADHILACGGYSCNPDGTDCGLTDACHTFNPTDGWELHSTLPEARTRDILVLSPDSRDPTDTELYPLLLGGNVAMTKIYKSGNWEDYLELPQDDWDAEVMIKSWPSKML